MSNSTYEVPEIVYQPSDGSQLNNQGYQTPRASIRGSNKKQLNNHIYTEVIKPQPVANHTYEEVNKPQNSNPIYEEVAPLNNGSSKVISEFLEKADIKDIQAQFDTIFPSETNNKKTPLNFDNYSKLLFSHRIKLFRILFTSQIKNVNQNTRTQWIKKLKQWELEIKTPSRNYQIEKHIKNYNTARTKYDMEMISFNLFFAPQIKLTYFRNGFKGLELDPVNYFYLILMGLDKIHNTKNAQYRDNIKRRLQEIIKFYKKEFQEEKFKQIKDIFSDRKSQFGFNRYHNNDGRYGKLIKDISQDKPYNSILTTPAQEKRLDVLGNTFEKQSDGLLKQFMIIMDPKGSVYKIPNESECQRPERTEKERKNNRTVTVEEKGTRYSVPLNTRNNRKTRNNKRTSKRRSTQAGGKKTNKRKTHRKKSKKSNKSKKNKSKNQTRKSISYQK